MSKTIRQLFKMIKYFDLEELENLLNYGLTFKEVLDSYELAFASSKVGD